MNTVLKLITNTNNNISQAFFGLRTPLITFFPKYNLDKFEDLPTAHSPGIYILYNEVSFGKQSVYVGETEDIYERMCQHAKTMGKNFWTHTIIMQDSKLNLNKAHYKFLEFMVYTYIQTADRVNVINHVIPTKSSLSRDDEIIAMEFLETIKDMFRLLNIKFLEPKVIGSFEEDRDVYYLYYKGASAKLRIKDRNEMYVLAGSTGVYLDEPPKDDFKNIYKQINTLIKQKQAQVIEGTNLIEYKTDIKFDSEHEACAFITMETLDGSDMWKDIDGMSLFANPLKLNQ